MLDAAVKVLVDYPDVKLEIGGHTDNVGKADDNLKLSVDRVLKNHPLDGVYYDWNVALFCCNPLHEGKKVGGSAIASGHWDVDELIDLM